MEAYTDFAYVYDVFMDNTPYDKWGGLLVSRLEKEGITDGILLDLGCGTGNMTELLSEKGYDMIGVDYSGEMLNVAMDKRARSGRQILYLQQDMREFELYGTVRAVVSVCDSVNYITEESELEEVFRLVNNYLDPGGIFVFDFNTEYKYQKILADNVFAEDRDECSFIWDNYYDEEDRINEYELSLFVRSAEDPELYRKYQEVHYQKAYTLEKIKTLLEKAGLSYLGAYDAYTQDAPLYTSQRICVVAQECQKMVR